MASYSVTTSKHATLAASTVDTVTLGSSDVDTALIVNVDGAGIIYATGDGTTPTVAGDDIPVVVPALAGAFAVVDVVGSAVKLISAGTPKYTVSKGGAAGGIRSVGGGGGSAGASGAGTLTNTADVTVDSTSGGVTALAANTNRKVAIIQNTGSANIRVGTTVTTSTGTQLSPGGYLVLEPPYPVTAAIKAIRESGTNSTVSAAEIA